MNRKTATFRRDRHSRIGLAAILVLAALAAPPISGTASEPLLDVKVEDERMAVYVDGELFVAYRSEAYGDGHRYPFLYPVIGPASGQSLTSFGTDPHPHHSSLFVAISNVRGEDGVRADYWHSRPPDFQSGRIYSLNRRVTEAVRDRIVIEDEVRWQRPGADPHLEGAWKLEITVPSPDIRLLDVTITYRPLQDLTVGSYGTFAARMHPDLAEANGGVIVNSEGRTGESATRNREALWVAYFGQREGRTEGLAIIQHPENPYFQAPYFTRAYGFFAPWPISAQSRNWRAGDTIVERFRVVAFAGSAEEAQIPMWAEELRQASGQQGVRR